MMKNFILSLLILNAFSSFTQETEKTYLRNHSQFITPSETTLSFRPSFYDNSLYFFGFVHGSATPQIIDFELLKHLSEKGLRHYAPEIDFSLAYFFNEYLRTGDPKILFYACKNYAHKVNQDTSVEFYKKWEKIYLYNQTLSSDKKIIIEGYDVPGSTALNLTHLAFIAPQQKTGIDIVDSLSYFKYTTINEVNIISGKPVWKSGKGWDYFFGDEKHDYFKRFEALYHKDSLAILSPFGEEAASVERIMSNHYSGDRESDICANFKTYGLPIIKSGEKIYANYGYYHIQQEKINESAPLAYRIKKECDIKVNSLLVLLTKSACLVRSKSKPTGTVMIKDVKFKGATYNGYKHSKSWDGDDLLERVNGLKLLTKVAKKQPITLFDLDDEGSPFHKTLYFANMSRGSKKWRTVEDAVTTDYFQYVFLVQHSKGNLPLAELENVD